MPLLVEAMILSTAGFVLGLSIAYVFELRRRARSDWRW